MLYIYIYRVSIVLCYLSVEIPSIGNDWQDLGDALAKAESLLSQQRYVCGKTFTYMDLRLFMTLIRFDAVYVVYFKTNVGTIEMNYPNLLEYCKDIYQVPGMAKAGG